MELSLLRQFQLQILMQSQFMLIAAEQINEGLQKNDITMTFYALQSFLNSSANIAKALWGQGGKRNLERQALRDSIGINDSSPLKITQMRNNFEHFDERLEIWWKEAPNHNCVDLNIISRKHIIDLSGSDLGWFRNFDPQTTTLTFWSEDFYVQELIDEVRRILPKLEEEANKPPWEMP